MNLDYSEHSSTDVILNRHYSASNQNIMAATDSECYERLPKLKRLSQRPSYRKKKIKLSNSGRLRHQVRLALHFFSCSLKSDNKREKTSYLR